MRGDIAWVAREADGTVYRIAAWTNVFPAATMDEDLLGGDRAALDRNVGPWLSAPDRREAPLGPMGGYGIAVTDFATRTVVGCQDYTRLDGLYTWPCYLRPDIGTNPKHRERDLKGRPFDEGFRNLERIHREGRILRHEMQDTGESRDSVGLGLREILEATLKTARPYGRFGFVTVAPPPPWRLLTFDPLRPDDVRRARDAIVGLGFALTPTDEAAWEEHIRHLRG